MAYLRELGSYQAKVLRTSKAIVEAERSISAIEDFTKRDALIRDVNNLRTMLRSYEGMVSFLNCCIEIDRQKVSHASAQSEAKQA